MIDGLDQTKTEYLNEVWGRIKMSRELSNAEKEYFNSFRRAAKYQIDINRVLSNNKKYREELIKFCKSLTDEEEILEIKFELLYLDRQAEDLRRLKRNVAYAELYELCPESKRKIPLYSFLQWPGGNPA